MDAIIHRYGFENKKTIRFCEMVESGQHTEDEIKKVFEKLLKNA